MQHSAKSKPKPRPTHLASFDAIGTSWSIAVYEPVSKFSKLEARIAARIEEFNKCYSRFRADSLVTQISQRAGTYELPEDAKSMIDLYLEVYELSDGEVTPMIGQTLSDAGYDAEYSLKPQRPISPPSWREVLDYEHPRLIVKRPVLLDFGAAGKGHLVDIVADMLRSNGVTKFHVDAGGDICSAGAQIVVGLEHPDDPSLAVGSADLLDQSLCGSSGNRRAWGGYNHILSPSKLRSPDHIKAVWVTAESTLLADMLTTGLYFVDASELQKHYTFEYVLINAAGEYKISDNFIGEMFR